jgi:hypothetical protein
MSEKIRALRKALEASGGKNQAQPQQAYGELVLLQLWAKLIYRFVKRKEGQGSPSNHHDLIISYRTDYIMERQEIP